MSTNKTGRIIKDGKIVDDVWTVLGKSDEAQHRRSYIIVPLSVWLAERDELAHRKDVGVWLNSDEEPETIGEDLDGLPAVAVNFPTFTDGRGYSIASIIRRKFAYKGELRAIGDVRRDQIEQMLRCGFNTFAVDEDQIEDALDGVTAFTYSYQSSIDRPEPLFRSHKL